MTGLMVVLVVEEEEEERFIQSYCSERGGPRARPRYPGVEDEFRRATFLRETHPYPSILPYCLVE